MDTALKDLWIDALRSGDYEQGRNALRDSSDRFCCLGVLCDVARVPWVGSPNPNRLLYGVRDDIGGGVLTGTLPAGFQTEIGLGVDDTNTLVELNDDDGRSFLEIADWIEETL